MWVYLKKSTTFYLSIAVLGTLFCWALIGLCQEQCALLGPGLSSAELILYHNMIQKPDYIVWMFFFVGTDVLGLLLAYPLWSSMAQFRPNLTRRKLFDLAGASIILLIAFILPDSLVVKTMGIPTPPISGFIPRVVLILLIDFICYLPALTGIWLIRGVIDEKFRNFERDEKSEVALSFLNEHIRLRDLSQEYLMAIGLNIAMIILASGANRNMLIAAGMDSARIPQLAVLTYGLYFTGVIILVYLPTYLTLNGTGRKAVEKIYPIDQLQNFSDVLEKRKGLEEKLHLNFNLDQSLRTGLVLLSPLITGLLSILFTK